jgi:hypothetical protein
VGQIGTVRAGDYSFLYGKEKGNDTRYMFRDKLISPSAGLTQAGQQENADISCCYGVCSAKMWQFWVKFKGGPPL